MDRSASVGILRCNVGIVLGSVVGFVFGYSDVLVLEITVGMIDGFIVGIDEGSEMVYLFGSFIYQILSFLRVHFLKTHFDPKNDFFYIHSLFGNNSTGKTSFHSTVDCYFGLI